MDIMRKMSNEKGLVIVFAPIVLFNLIFICQQLVVCLQVKIESPPTDLLFDFLCQMKLEIYKPELEMYYQKFRAFSNCTVSLLTPHLKWNFKFKT